MRRGPCPARPRQQTAAESPTSRVTKAVATLGSEVSLHVLARARRLERCGREVIHLEAGEVDHITPNDILAVGLPELRDAITQAARAAGIAAGPENVLVTSGTKPVIFHALVALIRQGDEVLVPAPAHPMYDSMVRLALGRPVHYQVTAARPSGIDAEEIARKVSPRTRVLILNTPHIPTGTVVPIATLGALATLAHRHGLIVIADEVHSRLVFDGCHRSIASLVGMGERTILVDGLSRTVGMTGGRLGYGIAPAALIRQLERMTANTPPPASTFVQHLGLATLTRRPGAVRELRDELRARRDLLVAGLNRIDGVTCATPRGGLFAFPRIAALLEALDLTVERFTDRLLEDFGLACLPGTVFGPAGAGHLRLSFAASKPTLCRALELLGEAVRVWSGAGYVGRQALMLGSPEPTAVLATPP
jgi:aspartate aminotransferase